MSCENIPDLQTVQDFNTDAKLLTEVMTSDDLVTTGTASDGSQKTTLAGLYAQFDTLYDKIGTIDIGLYEDLTGYVVTKANEAFVYNSQGWVIKDESLLDYTITGDPLVDIPNFKQIDFVTNETHMAEVTARQLGDASLQAQINAGVTITSGPTNIINYHGNTIENSTTIPDGQNAWSMGPVINLAAGVLVGLGNNTIWRII